MSNQQATESKTVMGRIPSSYHLEITELGKRHNLTFPEAFEKWKQQLEAKPPKDYLVVRQSLAAYMVLGKLKKIVSLEDEIAGLLKEFPEEEVNREMAKMTEKTP